MSNLLPREVLCLVTAGDGWIIGSAANPDTDLKNVRDFDLFIPHVSWLKVAPIVAMMQKDNTVVINSFGGWKIKLNSTHYEIDVWPDSMERLVLHTTNFWQPHRGIRLHRTLP